MTDDLKDRVKALIIEVLMFEDMEPADIDNEAPLFGEGLGLDSVDALELALEVERAFGVALPQTDETRSVFRSVTSLSEYIAAHKPA